MTEDFLRQLRSSVDLACLATSEKWTRVVDGELRKERMSDQTRRVALLISALTFGEGREGLCTEQRHVAAALDMDEGDCSEAIAKLEGWGILKTEQRAEGIWYQLLPARLTLSERATKAAAAFERLRQLRDRQPLLIARSCEERMDGGLGQALAEVDVEEALRGRGGDVAPGARKPVGNLPTASLLSWESPNSQLGISQLKTGSVGNLPTHVVSHGARVRAGIDSYSDRQIDDSGSCRSGGQIGASRFKDEERNFIFEQLEAIDVNGEMRDETCRRTWLGRVRDEPGAVHRGIDLVKEDMRTMQVRSPLGRAFRYAQGIARSAGRVLRMVMH